MLEVCPAQLLFEPIAQGRRGVDVGPRTPRPRHLGPRAVAIDLTTAGRRAPETLEPLDDPERGLGGQECPVECPDRRPHDEVRSDAGFQQGPEHADLDGTEHAPAAQDEGRMPCGHAPTLANPLPAGSGLDDISTLET